MSDSNPQNPLLIEAFIKIKEDQVKLNTIINGVYALPHNDASNFVTTDSGPVRKLSSTIAIIESELNDYEDSLRRIKNRNAGETVVSEINIASPGSDIVVSSTNAAAKLDVTTHLRTAKDLTVVGNSILTGTLGVTGATTLTTLGTSGLATLNSLTVTGASSLATLGTSGLATLNSLTVTGATTAAALTLSGNLIGVTSNFSGNATFQQNVIVQGTLTANAGVGVDTIALTTKKIIVTYDENDATSKPVLITGNGNPKLRIDSANSGVPEFEMCSTLSVTPEIRLINENASLRIDVVAGANPIVLSRAAQSADIDFLRLRATAPSGFARSIAWHDGTNTIGRLSLKYDGTHANLSLNSLYRSNVYVSTEILKIAATGTITLTPVGTTEIIRSNMSSGFFSFYNTAGSTLNGVLQFTDAVGKLSTEANIPLTFFTNATERARISAGGNFLIGTTVDGGETLQVVGSADISGVLTVGSLSATGGLSIDANLSVTGTTTLSSTLTRQGVLQTLTSSIALTTSDAAVLTFLAATYRSAKVIANVVSGGVHQSSELLIVHNGTTAYVTEYGVISSSGSNIAIFSVTLSGGNIILNCQTVSGTGNARIESTLIPV